MGTHPIFESDFDCLTDRNRTRCVPNCATFPASRSTPATAVAPSATMVSKSVSCLQDGRPLPRQEEPTQVALDSSVPSQAQEGYQPGSFLEATCPTQRQGTKGRRRSLLHGAVGQEATEARDPSKTT